MTSPTHEVALEFLVFARHRDLSQVNARPEGSQLERSAYILLSRVGAEGPMSIGQLSDAFALDVSTLNRQTAALKSAGLLERIPDPDGGIARKFRLTEEGRRRLDAEREAHVRALNLVMTDWPEEDIASFAGFLRRFNTGIERLDGRPWPRS
ncbi:MarR family winged helix-turn-helix transcriptional regulator [Kitasatospora sp. NPDC057542]|uniref:MarR family winged helix-turn-helix transcriptional regulator n=1 Tax=Streptomycetaceae TaxID=2062 RepID=UPI001CCBB444|nr:MarR family transcriptional regulator [Streptomyces sp. LS1784]